MNLGRRYWSSRLHKLSDEQRKALENYPKNFGHAIKSGVGLYLWGTNSTGKTYTAASFCIEAVEKFKISCYMVRAAELKEAWIKDFPAHEDSEETVLWRIKMVNLLVIDDLGKEYRTSSGFSETNLGTLIRERCRKRQTTFITTNLAPEEFLDVYGFATAELLKECTISIKFNGGNYRNTERKKIMNLLKD